jgi:enoyl-CoA hydratase/carnithine racemase
MTENRDLLVERRDGILWICLNRADKANALAVAMMERAAFALEDAGRDPKVRAILLTGAGERVFCAGADVREQPVDGDIAAHRQRRAARLAALIDSTIECPKPVIAALNGTASGGGAMLALLCDARVAVDSAAISLPEIDLGMPTFIGASIAEQMGGLALAVDLVQSGRRMPAAEALTRGLVNEVVPRSDLDAAATARALALAGKDPHAFEANKRWLNRRMKAVLAEARAAHDEHRKRLAP